MVSGAYAPAAERGLRYDDPGARPGMAAAGIGHLAEGCDVAAARDMVAQSSQPISGGTE